LNALQYAVPSEAGVLLIYNTGIGAPQVLSVYQIPDFQHGFAAEMLQTILLTTYHTCFYFGPVVVQTG
jgi:hypothetical protein